jgi:hypothetical protein
VKKNIAAIGLATLLAATLGMAQLQHKVSAKISHEFTAAGKVLPAGQYDFFYDIGSRQVTIKGTEKGSSVIVPVITLLAGAIHTTPNDSHIVFDKIGNKYSLSEIWIPGIDGISLLSTKEMHEHEIVNAPR